VGLVAQRQYAAAHHRIDPHEEELKGHVRLHIAYHLAHSTYSAHPPSDLADTPYALGERSRE
ncbi:MAG TPA: hypothetical protein VJW23_14765, partial [Propionibacteriaceae bacterium]|nr:hypothetical protein [Propionibacteriaceae bacterium]